MLSSHDADLVRRDSALPGLATLWDPDAFASRLRAEFSEVEVGAARITYLRYKPGMNCLASYTLEVEGLEVEAYAKAYGGNSLTKLKKAQERSQEWAFTGSGIFILRDSAIAVFLFPFDSKLKSLARLGSPLRSKRLLRGLFPTEPSWWSASVKSLRYKPERRCVLQLMLGDQPVAVLKFHTENGYLHAKSKAKAFQSGSVLRIPRLLASSDRHHVLAMEWLHGTLLRQVLAEPGVNRDALQMVGAALAEFHQQKRIRLPVLSREAEANRLLELAHGIGSICPPLAERARKLAVQMTTSLAQQEPRSFCIHGDLYAKQMLIGERKVGFLDFDEAMLGDPASDLGNFIAHLERDAQRQYIRSNSIDLIRENLLQGYGKPSGEDVGERLQLYTAVNLFQLLFDPFRFREPEWPQRTEQILQRAESYMQKVPVRSFPVKDKHKEPVVVADPFGVRADARMPFLAAALDPEGARLHLQSALSLRFNLEWLQLHEIRVTRYKPEKRCLMEYEADLKLRNGSIQHISLVGKARAKGLNEKSYHALKSFREAGLTEQAVDGIAVPEPMGTIPDFHMYLQRKAPGIAATHLLLQVTGLGLAGRIAEAIHKLHCAEVPTLRRHTIREELSILEKRLNQLSETAPQWKTRITHLFQSCCEIAASIPEPKYCGIHRDFYPDQVLVEGNHLYLLDFDMYCEGDPALDAGNFLGHLSEESLRTYGDPDLLQDCKEAFRSRFLQLSGASSSNAIRVYEELTLARLVSLSAQFPDRRGFTEAMLELCEQRIHELLVSFRKAHIFNASVAEASGDRS